MLISRLIAVLRERGHDVSAVSRATIPKVLPTRMSWLLQRSEKRILVVADRDFGELIFHQGLAHAGVLFFRIQRRRLLEAKLEQLKRRIEKHAVDLTRGEFLVVSSSQIRRARRPRS